jgi:hypothetical protein
MGLRPVGSEASDFLACKVEVTAGLTHRAQGSAPRSARATRTINSRRDLRKDRSARAPQGWREARSWQALCDLGPRRIFAAR